MNRLRPKAIDDGIPWSALTVYSSASQSPMNGSTKTRMRTREISAGGSHQRQDENSLERIGTVTIFDLSFSDLPLPLGEGRGEGRSYGRKIRSHYHQALTLPSPRGRGNRASLPEPSPLERDTDCRRGG